MTINEPRHWRVPESRTMKAFLKRLAATSLPALALALPATPVLAQAAPTAVRHGISEICAGERCTWEKVMTCDGFIEGINFDAEGQMWMVAVVSGRIMRVENGHCVTVAAGSGTPNGAKFAADGRLFVANRTKGIQTLDPATGKVADLFSRSNIGAFKGLNDLVFDPRGGYYFTDPVGSDALAKTGHVYYVAPNKGSTPQVFAGGIAYPNGIAVSPDGQNVYVSEFGENRVLMIPSRDSKDPFGIAYVFARLQGGIGPDGLIVDATGNVYVAHYGAGEIAIFDDHGFPYGSIPLPRDAGLGSTNMAFKDGYLYVTESLKNTVWRVAVKTRGLPRAPNRRP
jgi:gluconolactonase